MPKRFRLFERWSTYACNEIGTQTICDMDESMYCMEHLLVIYEIESHTSYEIESLFLNQIVITKAYTFYGCL